MTRGAFHLITGKILLSALSDFSENEGFDLLQDVEDSFISIMQFPFDQVTFHE